jgi:hypothetical protein
MPHSGIGTGSTAERTWLGTDAKVVRHVRVCGNGQLAAATRTELERLGIQRNSDYLLPALRPPLVIACGDSEADESFGQVARRASEEGSPLLLACLCRRVVRIGPLIEASDDCFVGLRPAQSEAAKHDPLPGSAASSRVADSLNSPGLYARLAALLVSAQALNFLLGARNQCVLDRVVEINPWSMESKTYRVLKVRQ